MSDTAKPQTPCRYVAFLDILGWAGQVLSGFDFACETYRSMLDLGKSEFSGVESVRIISDSMLLVGLEPWSVIKAANALHFVALSNDCLVRGGIAYGRHVEFGEYPKSHMVSEALITAVRHERTVGHPCVVVDKSALPNSDPKEFLSIDTFLRPLLFHEGQWIVNPFNIMWGTSAANRVRQLREAHPEYASKYDWFLRLHEAVASRQPLIP